jgi:hypothetical protein
MKLLQDVTFDSLAAVRHELHEWFGSDGHASLHGHDKNATRDMLLSIIIHSLAEELSNVRVRSQIQASLSQLSHVKDHFRAD